MKVLGFDIRVTPSLISQRTATKLMNKGKKLRARLNSRFKVGLSQAGQRAKGLASQLSNLPGLAGKTAYEVKSTDDGWMIALKGSTLPLRVFPKKQEAVREAKKMARAHKTELAVYTKQGSLQAQESFA